MKTANFAVKLETTPKGFVEVFGVDNEYLLDWSFSYVEGKKVRYVTVKANLLTTVACFWNMKDAQEWCESK